MAWFITSADPNLAVTCDDGRVIRFRDAEYRTEIAGELSALRADPRVKEVRTAAETRPLIRRWALNLATGKVHDVARRRYHCYLSDELITAASEEEGTPSERWGLYRRLEDLQRWNPHTEPCKYCGGGDDGH